MFLLLPLCPRMVQEQDVKKKMAASLASLAEIAKYCNGLSSERQTERKSSVSKLLDRLKDTEVQDAIDHCSSSKNKKRVTWDVIAQSVFAYVVAEADILKGASKLTEDTILRRKKDISETFRSVIQIAEKRGPTLKAADVYHHIWRIMCDERTKIWFCNEYTNVLFKNFLSVHVHVCEISTKIWHDLVYVYCNLIRNPPPRADTSLFAQTLKQLTAIAGNLPVVKGGELFKFFGDIFKDIRDEKSETVVSYLVSALNNFAINIAADCRGQLCILGEDLFPLLLPLFKKASVLVKDKAIDFFLIQIDAHHPHGVFKEEEGAWSSNESFWKKCLTKLHEAICTEFEQLAGKLQWSGSKVALAQNSNFIDLAVATFNQIFYIQKQKQLQSEPSAENDFASARKKQKVESGWQVVLDGIAMVSCPAACVAWLQFFTAFLKQYPKCFPYSEYYPFLSCLGQAMVNCKRPDVLNYLLRASCALADNIAMLIDKEAHSYNAKEINACWQNIWFETLKAIHSRNVDGHGFLLLVSILKADILTCCQDTYKIFFASGTKVSRESMILLLNLMQRYPVPEKLDNTFEIYNQFEKSSKFRSRMKMIDLILPDIDFAAGNKNYNKLLSFISKESVGVYAVVITSVLQKNPSITEKEIEDAGKSSRIEPQDDDVMKFKRAQTTFLRSAFNTEFDKTQTKEMTCKSRSNTRQSSGIIPELYDYLSRRITETKECVISLQKNEEFCKSANHHCNWLGICVKYFSLFLDVLSLSCTTLDSCAEGLQNALKEASRSFFSNATSVIRSAYRDIGVEEENRDEAVLLFLNFVNGVTEQSKRTDVSSTELLDLFPDSFLDLLMEITTGRLSAHSKHSSRQRLDDLTCTSSSSTTLGDFDDLMDCSERIAPTQRNALSPSGQQGSHDDVSDRADTIRVEACKVLCKFAFVKESGPQEVSERNTKLKDAMLDFLEEKFETRKMMFFNMLETVVHHLKEHSIHLQASDLEVIFECIRRFVSDQRSDQHACLQGLQLLHILIDFLQSSSEDADDELTQVRCITIKVISAFWSLRNEKYSPDVRLNLLECLVKLMQVDPKGYWNKLEIAKKGKRSGTKETELLQLEDLLLQLLSDTSHIVRMRAASYVITLFRLADNQNEPASPSQQKSAFDKVAIALTDLIVIKEDVSEDEIEDVSANRAATLLYVLKQIAVSSSLCEKKALALLFHDYKEKFLDLKLVGKVFKEIAHERGFPDTKDYLKEHLGHLCYDWLRRGFPIIEFPSSVVHLDTKEFLRYYAREIIPYLMFYRDQDAFEKIQQKLELQDPWSELLIDNFDRIIVLSLPFYACQSKRMQRGLEEDAKIQEMEGDRKRAKLAYEFLESTLTKEVIEKLLLKKFDDIVIELLLRMCDPPSEDSDASQFMRETDAPPNPPYFTSYAIRGTLEYLASCHRNKSIVEVLSQKKDSIQKILLALSKSVTQSKTEREKVRVLCAYRLIVLLLLDDLQNGLGMNWAYFIRDVIHRCCHWLNWHLRNGVDDKVFVCVIQILQRVTEASFAACSQEFESHVKVIVNSLVRYAQLKNDNGRKALRLLRLIILDNGEKLRDSISNLAPFPDSQQFAAFSKKINDLKTEDETRDSFEDLRILHQEESISTEALELFLKILKSDRTFMERFIETQKDGTTKLLSILAHLLRLTSNSNAIGGTDAERKIKLVIGKCIGEIGPLDFHSLALPISEDHLSAEEKSFFGSNVSSHRYHAVLDRLCNLLTNESIEVASAASSTLKDALHTKAGIQHLSVYDLGRDEKPKFFLYSEPFKASKGKKGSQLSQMSQKYPTPSVNEFIAIAGGAELWQPGSIPYESWIKEMSSRLIKSGAVEDEIFSQMAPVCNLNVKFAELLFPFLVHNILTSCTDELRSTLSSLFNGFVSSYLAKCSLLSVTNVAEKQAGRDKAARMMIRVVNYLRKQNKPMQHARMVNTKWDNNFWLDIKYLDLAQMAFECSSYFAAVMFTEIWCDIQRQNPTSTHTESSSSSQGTQWEALSDQSGETEERASCQRLLFEAYRNIGEPDGIYGVGIGYSSDIPTRVKAYEHEKDYGKALLTQNLQGTSEESIGQLELAQNLERAGLHQVMQTYLRGIDRNTVKDIAEYEELQFEASWRNGIWDLETQSRTTYQDKTSFSGSIYDSIVALKEGNQGVFGSMINEARIHLLTHDGITDNVSTSRLYHFMSKMNAVTELENYGREYFSKEFIPIVLKKKHTLANDFQYFEFASSLKAAALKITLQREMSQLDHGDSCKDDIAQEAYFHLLNTAVLAREAGRFQVCERHLQEISQLESMVQIPTDWKIEQAKMFWFRGEKNRAMHLLKSLLRNCEKGKDHRLVELYPVALGLYGHWLAETRSENPGVIIDEYMEHAACLLEDSQNTQSGSPTEAYYLLAKYADSQYQGIKDYIKSSAFENKQTVIKKVKTEINRLKEMGDNIRGTANRYYRSLVAQCEEDETELQQMLKDRKQFLQKALENYVRCLCTGDKYDMRIFRLCSLWLDNSHEPIVNQIMKACISKMESRKFLPLMYQLAARMGSRSSGENLQFNENLEQLIEKAAKKHPYHVTVIIMALCNVEDEAPDVATAKRGKLSRKTSNTKQNGSEEQSRVQTAKSVINKLKKVNPALIESMEVVMQAYIELAYFDIQHLKRQTGKFDLPNKLVLKRLKDLKYFAMPTLEIPVDPSCQYRNIVYITGFDDKFTHCGGINLPKVITCIGSDGIRRKQLVKGKDDLRQDAVMQQVFGMVNRLLKENPETRKRELRIRTYKVVPLSQRSGIVEWCENTVPLGEYLVGIRGIGGAHSKYHPTDWAAAECRKKFSDATHAAGKKSKYNVFQDIMKHFRPVFRHFFYEKFTDPADWFTRRLAYTRSLASTSIVGYVVGLGDRHVQNILVDVITAELVHIDLGIAFEQGKQLPTPETIPFRLTRDLVDGMGITGVEGVFRRCCEKIMDLMRNSHEAILTIVEVLLYDPLYVWTLSPLQAVQVQQKTTEDPNDTLQNMSAIGDANLDSLLGELQSVQPQQDHSKNKMAQRVLIRLKQKLDGNEGGSFLSTEGQVNFLIQSARDAKNLCRVFPGWQPWL